MKKLSVICLSVMLVFAMSVSAFAEQVFTIDPISGEIITGTDGRGNITTANYADVSSSCRYDKTKKLYMYNFAADEKKAVCCSVYNGMITTDAVYVSAGSLSDVSIFLGGNEISKNDYSSLSDTGTYIVRNNDENKELLRFTIVKELTGDLTYYEVPGIFYVSKVIYNSQTIVQDGNTVSLENEGSYEIYYSNDSAEVSYVLSVEIDHTPPQLIVDGVVDGEARQAVSFGELEDNAGFILKKDGVEINYTGQELKDAGTYLVTYSDAAGNTVKYQFVIKTFLDSGAWIYVGIVAAIILAAIGYMIYSGKHLRAY